MTMRLEGKIVLVTGGASGLGAADSVRLAEEGARVILTDITTEAGEALAARLPGAAFLPHDVRSEADWARVIGTVLDRHGRLDVLVNNAGVLGYGSIEDVSLDAFRFANAVMAEGTFLGCQAAIRAMKPHGGSIINIASVAGVKGVPPVLAYSAAKGAILAMTRTIAAHCHAHNYRIRCNAIAPGSHATPMVADALAKVGAAPPDADSAAALIAPEDQAALVAFLASEESRFINGATIVIDNGVIA